MKYDNLVVGTGLYGATFAPSSAVEDEPDTGKVYLNTEKFRALAEGIPCVGGRCADALTGELTSQFLDDYLTGDRYSARPVRGIIWCGRATN